MVGVRARTVPADLGTAQLPVDSCFRPVSKHWSSAGDVRALLSDFLDVHPPAHRLSRRDADAVSEPSTAEMSESDLAEGLHGAGEAQSLFGSLFDAASLEESVAPTAGRKAMAVKSSVVVEKREKKEVDAWTAEEDLLILRLVDMNGKRWSKIAESLPGRSDNGVRNRWNRIERAHALRQANGSDAGGYRCRRCGLPKRGHTCAALTQGVRAEDLAARNVELTRISSQLHLGVGTPPLKLGKGVVKKQPNGQQGKSAGKAKMLKAAGNAVIALERMDKPHPPKMVEPIASVNLGTPPLAVTPPYYDVASQSHSGSTQHGISFDDCRLAARRHSPTIPDQPKPDRHTGLSGTFARTDLGPISLGPAAPSKVPAQSSRVDPEHSGAGYSRNAPDVSVDVSVATPDASVDMSEANFDDFLMELHQSIIAPPLLPLAHAPAPPAAANPGPAASKRNSTPTAYNHLFAGSLGAAHNTFPCHPLAHAPALLDRKASEDYPAAGMADGYFLAGAPWADGQ
jgi:hypothetical protein